MTDHDASSLSRPNAAVRPLARTSIPRSSGSYGSYGSHGTGESGPAPGSPLYDTSIDSTALHRPSRHKLSDPSTDPQSIKYGVQNSDHDGQRKRRPHKPRPSGGFLLSNGILNENSKPGLKHRDDGRRKSRIPVDNRKGKSPLRSSDDHNSAGSVDPHDAMEGQEEQGEQEEQDSTGAHHARTSTGRPDVRHDRPHSQMDVRRRSMIPSLRPSSAPLDVDSTQIVSMALDLSESRRLASRRIISSPIPPRLAQLPDSTAGRSLKQHLQQQRRTSRNISPRADRNLSPRIISTSRMSSPLQPTFDHDGSYTYHFSSSTLDRTQRAKEYLELMAQYRRLLSFVTPLKQNARSRPSTSTSLTSPNSTGSPLDLASDSQNRALGRAYNPLQYIRNRKIRTRERKTIDGEVQGFADIPRATDWVDKVAASAASSPTTQRPHLPPFPAADEYLAQQLPASNLPRPVSATNKSKRPRFEWSIEPADMLADIYWLEQDNNRFLIEDRHYAKIYTPQAELPQQTAKTTEPPIAKSASKGELDADGGGMSGQDVSHSIKTDVETTLSSTRDRARQKLQDLRGMHHKHSFSTHSHHDFLKFRRGSISDSSDNESDRRRRGRSGTISASGQDLLEKQMNEMLAKESQDEQEDFVGDPDISHLKPLPAPSNTPERASRSSHRHRRTDSRMEAAVKPGKALIDKPNQNPPIHSGRTSLEVPGNPYRSSVDLDSPRLLLSDIASRGRQNGYVPAIGMDLSPAVSRPSSPARKPFSKVKSIFRDRSRDRSRDREDRENDDRITSPTEPTAAISIFTVNEDTVRSLQRQRSKSSSREFTTKPTNESHKSHRSMGSLSLKPDEQVGLRTIFKGGAKLDDMIRGGVSKMTDFIWKKDSDSSDSSDDDSETDDRRGRLKHPALLSPGSSVHHYDSRRPVKNYMDIMPNFKSPIGPTDQPATHKIDDLAPVSSRPPSRSPRFEQLKPPRIDIRKASLDLSELEESSPRNPNDPNISDVDSHFHDSGYTARRPRQTSKELQNALSIYDMESSLCRIGNGRRASNHRNWVIPDRTSLSPHVLLSRREVARLRALILCSGIKAMEISRRANEPRPLFSKDTTATGLQWTEMKHFMPDGKYKLHVPQTELFPTSARILSHSINHSIEVFEKSVSEFSTNAAPRLQQRVEATHNSVAMDLMDMTRRAADEADEVSQDIVDYQRLKVKNVVDTMDKMLRRRRRRFRWVRRAGWLAVEWVLVGFMWYVWFIVMITRIVLGAGRGVVSAVRWLLWI